MPNSGFPSPRFIPSSYILPAPVHVLTEFRITTHSYFNRDVECVRTFFSRRFKYESSVYPKFSSTIRDGVREFDLDVEVAASGFKREDRKALDDVRDLDITWRRPAVADLCA